MRVKFLAQEHNTMSLARAQTTTTQSGDERTIHEATTPPYLSEGEAFSSPGLYLVTG